MRIPRFLALLSLATLVLCAASFADQIISLGPFNNSDIGLTATFSNGIGSVTLSGFSANSAPAQIYSKGGGGDEDGLGLDVKPTPDPDHEISGTAFLQFTAAGINSAVIGSLQDGEKFILYGSKTAGVLGSTILFSGTGGEQVSVTGLLALTTAGGYTYVDLFSPTGNILLDSLDTPDARVPEPSTTAMILTLGLVGLFEVGRRKLMV